MTAALGLMLALALAAQNPPKPVVVASKPFAESYLLAEMFAQVLEDAGFAVDRRPGLGATEIAFGALRTGAIDVYPEYTGTGLLAILDEDAIADPRATYQRVSSELAAVGRTGWSRSAREHVRHRGAAGDRQRHSLHTLSDLGGRRPSWWPA
jgi:glycine betaine/choline ABC-type transport system substrate-binding protein